jgi:hypothetical protein
MFLLCGLSLTACEKKAAPTPAAAAGSATAPTPTAPTPTAPTPTTPTPTTPTPTAPTPTAPAAATGPLPSPAKLGQGKPAWAVYPLTAAQARAKAAGVAVDVKDPSCDVAVAAPPPAPKAEGDLVVAAYYGSSADAEQVAKALGPVVWTGQVKTMCMD